MRRFGPGSPLLLLVVGTVLAAPRETWKAEELVKLQVEYRQVPTNHRLASVRREERTKILKAAVDLEFGDATKWAVNTTRDCGDNDIQRALLTHLQRKRPDSPLVIGLFREIAATPGPNRERARDFLLQWAVDENQQPWLERLFEVGMTEDKFLALQALGRLASATTLDHATGLLEDRSWKPAEEGIVHAGTIALAVQSFEGEEGACFLLLLQKDDRFRAKDMEAVRHATRVWKHADLKRYISLRALGDPDSVRRAKVARFLGRVGIETARAPLLARARDRYEKVEVRVAATEALGGLRLSRGALTRDLRALLSDPETEVRKAAVRALAELKVRQAAAALVELLDSPLAAEARRELAARNGLPAETDWSAWLAASDCPLPEGT